MKRWAGGVLIGLLFLSGPGVAASEERVPLEELLVDKGILTEDEAASVQKRRLSSLIDRITFNNDLRLRYDAAYMTTADDRYRMRFRLRLGADFKLNTITIGVRLASGTGEQVSTNQSFDNLSSQKALWIDRAYVRWEGESTRWVAVTGGRMPNPFFVTYASEMVWDDDFNPEGVAENFAFKRGGADVFFNVAQIVLDEDSAGRPNTDQWLFGQQAGVKVSAVDALQTTFAVAYYNAVNAQNSTLGQTVVQPGNSRCDPVVPAPPGCVANQLINDYNVVAFTAVADFKAGSVPLSVMGDYVVNTVDTLDSTGAETENSGYQAGVVVGKAGEPGAWEAAYFYRRTGTDATLADIADGDFGLGGTGRKGSIVWAAYTPNKVLQFKAKYFMTELEDDRLAPDDVNKVQADLVIKF